jgi:hypothetical protein
MCDSKWVMEGRLFVCSLLPLRRISVNIVSGQRFRFSLKD